MPPIHARRLAAGLASVAVVSSGAALGAAPASAAEGPLTITSVTVTNVGGGLSGHLPVQCAVAVEFTDGTPAATTAYEVVMLDEGGAEVDAAADAFDTDADPTDLRMDLACAAFTQDQPLDLVLREHADEGIVEVSDPVPFTYEVTDHPTGISDSSVMQDGHWTNLVGKPASITFTGGEWEPGTRFDTRIWTSRTRQFTAADWTDNVTGNAGLVEATDLDAPVLSWTPRPRDAGRWVWISIVGQVPGKAPWTFWFAPEYVSYGAQPRAAWYRGYGEKVGVARVGRTVKVTRPELTTAGSRAGVTTSHRWYVKQGTWKPLTGAGSTKSYLRLTRALRGKQVMVKVTYRAPRYASFQKSFVWSAVRR